MAAAASEHPRGAGSGAGSGAAASGAASGAESGSAAESDDDAGVMVICKTNVIYF